MYSKSARCDQGGGGGLEEEEEEEDFQNGGPSWNQL